MRQALGFGKQGDKGLFQRLTRRVRFKLIGAAGRQNFPAFMATSQSKRSASSM